MDTYNYRQKEKYQVGERKMRKLLRELAVKKMYFYRFSQKYSDKEKYEFYYELWKFIKKISGG